MSTYFQEEEEKATSSIPDDITAYYEKIDNEDDETDEQVCTSGMYRSCDLVDSTHL